MNFVVVEAKYIYSIYIYIYMYHGYPGMSKQVFHQLLELDAFASTRRALVSLRSEVDHEELL